MTTIRDRASMARGGLRRTLAALTKRAGAAIFSKRAFDIVFASIALLVCLPLFAVIAIAVALTSPGPVFFVQQRVGKHHRPFDCVKFRTMVEDAEGIMPELLSDSPELHREFDDNYKLKDDPRVTAIGRFLRFSSLDELPQFWNVLRGEMSVVGPRPLVPEELYRYGRAIDTVLTVRPGITGLWQVSGRNNIPYKKRVQIDTYYANSRDWKLDAWIILRTIGVLLLPHRSGAC